MSDIETAMTTDAPAPVLPTVLQAPASGRVAGLSDVPDPVFSGEVLGPGCAVWPDDGVVRAPMSGRVTACMSHAFGILSPSGVEVLVHVGVDTVEMRGEGFVLAVREGDEVEAGQPVIAADLDRIAAAGHPDCVVVAVTGVPAGSVVELVARVGAIVEPAAPLLRVRVGE